MFATRLRTSPWSARCRKSSEGRSKTSSPSTCLTVMSAGRVRSSWPFGPSTLTWPGARVTFTDFGTWTGSFPIRDNSFYLLPDERQDFAAEAFACRLPSAHNPLSSAGERDAEAAEHPRDLGLARVLAQPGPADRLHTRADPGAVRARPEEDTHRFDCAGR